MDTKEIIKFGTSIFLLICGMVLAFISLFIPPKGVIDSSVLMLIGEIFSFVGAVWGIAQYANIQIHKINNSIPTIELQPVKTENELKNKQG